MSDRRYKTLTVVTLIFGVISVLSLALVLAGVVKEVGIAIIFLVIIWGAFAADLGTYLRETGRRKRGR